MTAQTFKIYADSKMGVVSNADINFFEIFKDIGLKKDYTIGVPLTLFQDQENGKITLPKGMWDFTMETNAILRTIQTNMMCQMKLNIKNYVNSKEMNDRSESIVMGFAGNLYYTTTFRLALKGENNTFEMMMAPDIVLTNGPAKNTFIDLQKITLIGTKIADLS